MKSKDFMGMQEVIEMILAIDVSNNHVAVGLMEDGELLYASHMSSVKTRTADEYAVLMDLMAKHHGVDLSEMEGCIVSSVVPELTAVLCTAAEKLTGKRALRVGRGLKTGLNIRIDEPSELASDFVAVAVSALERYPLPCVTVNMDTAVAIGVLDKKGSYIGGVIAPGVMVSQIALSRGASQLYSVAPKAPGRVIAKNTADSMRGGIIYGTAAMLDGLLTGIDEELGETANVVATGEWADKVIPYCRRPNITVDKDLAMRGLWSIYKKNER